MIWIHYGLITGSLTLAAAPFTNTQAQPQSQAATNRAAPAAGTAVVEGSVVDAATRKPVAGAAISVKNQQGAETLQQRTGADGAFDFMIDSKQRYALRITAEGFEPHESPLYFTSVKVDRLLLKALNLYRIGTKPPIHQNATTIETPASTSAATKAVPLPMTTVTGVASRGPSETATTSRVTPPKTLDAKVTYTPPLLVAATGKTTALRAIQFVQSKAELLPDAQPALEQLATFLKSNPTAEIELAGHTDNQGDFDENVRLSKQRVEVVKAYLVSNGIAAGRIATRGYGPTRPIGSNNAEATRQQNRRVEMTVLKQ